MKDDYYYYSRTEEAKSYPIYCRKHESLDSPEEIILDVNKLAEGKQFTQVNSVTVSPDHNIMAFTVDYSGDEKYLVRLVDLRTGEFLPDTISDVSGGGNPIVWHRTLKGFFYTSINKDLRPDTVMFHELGGEVAKDKIVLQEKNPTYSVDLAKSASDEYLIISSAGLSSDESQIVSLKDNDFNTQLVKARATNVKYKIEHNDSYIYMLTNDAGPNFRITRADIKDLGYDNWKEYIPLDTEKALLDFSISNNYILLNYTQKALPLVKVLHMKDGKAQILTFPDEAFTAKAYSTNFLEDDIRVEYSSLIRPKIIYTYDFYRNKLSVLKSTEVLGGYNPEEYEVRRLWADNKGVKIPVSLFYKKSLFKKDGTNPLYLYGYGSYGIAVNPSFRNDIISLVNKGFIFAIAHIRGGEELGYDWYQSAKFLNKKNTFEDYIACSEFLIQEQYTSKGNIVASGGSAGGLLVGAVINMKPELYKVAVAHVPFVDMLNTMLDESLPLTPGEFEEWGNPKKPEFFEYMKSYSPYDNVIAQDYPNIYSTAGVSDPRVGYWEAAKWVAKLREYKTDDNVILLHTNMSAGHFSSADRFEQITEYAEEYAFILKVFGIK